MLDEWSQISAPATDRNHQLTVQLDLAAALSTMPLEPIGFTANTTISASFHCSSIVIGDIHFFQPAVRRDFFQAGSETVMRVAGKPRAIKPPIKAFSHIYRRQ